jgi:predicted amidohydrolase YtcJ
MSIKKPLLYLISIIIISSCVKFKKVDLVIHNAKIYTVNELFGIDQAMAIKDGKIVAIGKEREIMNKYRADYFFDAQTQPIYPGFIDAHSHFIGYGLNKLSVNLSSCKSLKEINTKLIGFKEKHTANEWLIGYGWDENNWVKKSVSNILLNEIFPNTPVLLWRIDGHSLLVNNKAIELVNNPTEFVNGVVKDKFINEFTSKINYTESQLKQAMRIAQEACIENGLTTVADAGLTNKEINALLNANKHNQLGIRVYAMLKPTEANFTQFESKGPFTSNYLNITAFKLLVDGSFGSETACLLKPYENSNSYGELLLSQSEILNYAERIKEAGFQLNAHCIGDSSVRVTLNSFGEVLKKYNDLRWRIEHAQMVNTTDLPLFAKYSILPSVQPTHGISDIKWAVNKVGEERINSTYLVKTLLAQNGIIAFGTDFPVEEINPIKTFYNAIYRDSTINYLSKETVTREEALKAMTFWAAMANLQESNRGSLEVGKFADFVILNRDIMSVSNEEILNTEVMHTFVGGIQY